MVGKRERNARELGFVGWAVLFETLSRSIVGWRIAYFIDAKTAFDADWDETLFRELEEAEKDNEADHDNDNNGVVLTAHPLGYDLETSPVLIPETYETDHHVFIYGKRIFPSKEERNAPAMLTAHAFGKHFPHFFASKLHAKPQRSLKSPFVSNLFTFGPSEAFIRDLSLIHI